LGVSLSFQHELLFDVIGLGIVIPFLEIYIYSLVFDGFEILLVLKGDCWFCFGLIRDTFGKFAIWVKEG